MGRLSHVRTKRSMSSSSDSVLWAFHRLHELGLLYKGAQGGGGPVPGAQPLYRISRRGSMMRIGQGAMSSCTSQVPYLRRRDDVIPGMDDHAVDLAVECRARGEPGPGIRAVSSGRRTCVGCRGGSRSPSAALGAAATGEGPRSSRAALHPGLPALCLACWSVRGLARTLRIRCPSLGIVHLAPAFFGEDDEVLCRAAGISGPMPVADDGRIRPRSSRVRGNDGVRRHRRRIITWLAGSPRSWSSALFSALARLPTLLGAVRSAVDLPRRALVVRAGHCAERRSARTRSKHSLGS